MPFPSAAVCIVCPRLFLCGFMRGSHILPRIHSSCHAQLLQFGWRKLSHHSGEQCTQAKRSLSHANQTQDGQIEIPAHASDLPVQPLVQSHFQNCALECPLRGNVGAFRQNAYLCRGQFVSFLQGHAVLHGVQSLCRHLAAYQYVVDARQVVAGMHNMVGQFAVIGQKHQSFREKIQTSGGIEPVTFPRVRHKIQNGLTAFRVLCGADHLYGLVQHETAGGARCGPERLAVNLDAVLLRIDQQTWCGDQSVHRHTALGEEFIGLAAGAQTGPGKGLVDADGVLFHKFPLIGLPVL